MGKARMKRGGNKGKNGETSKRRKTLVQILNEIPNFPESQRIAKLEECIIDPDEWILAEVEPDGSNSSLTENIQQLSLGKEKTAEHDKPKVVIPSHLRVPASESSQICFGSFCLRSSDSLQRQQEEYNYSKSAPSIVAVSSSTPTTSIIEVMNLGGFSPPRPACPRLSLGNDHKASFALPLAQYYPKIVYPVPISKMVYPLARLHQSNVSALGYEAGSSTNASSIRDVDLFGSLNREDEQFNTCQQNNRLDIPTMPEDHPNDGISLSGSHRLSPKKQ